MHYTFDNNEDDSKRNQNHSSNANEKSSALSTPKILVCNHALSDENPLKSLLEKNNQYTVVIANTFSQALKIIQNDLPDLLLLDITIPNKSSFNFLNELESLGLKIPCILITDDASIDFALKTFEKGASDYIKKPFQPNEIYIRIKNLLEQEQDKIKKNIIESEKVHLEAQLRQSQKMETIGTLTGGIAHDFNNVLSIILGNAELVKLFLTMDHKAYSHVEQLLSASERAKELIKHLLNFSRKEEVSLEVLNVKKIIIESLRLMRASLPTNINIEQKFIGESFFTLADSTEIQQIIFNLCNNSAYVMENGGAISVSLSQEKISASETIGTLKAGDYIKLIVSDTGKGIPEDIISHVLDPYFTTKEAHEGTGMGLAVVNGIIMNYGGAINIKSTVSVGTQIEIYFPKVEPYYSTEVQALDRRILPRGEEHILLVDDEEMIVELMEKVLLQLGYKVTSFCSSEKALEAFLSEPNKYDLVITDMTMPILSGIDLIKAIKDKRINIPVILSTGYNSQVNKDVISLLKINSMIMKPVAIEELATTVRKVLPPNSDRRKTPRYSVPEGAVVYSKGFSQRFNLLDLGLSGLAFMHDKNIDLLNQNDLLSIMSNDGNILISDIPCYHVSNVSLLEAGHNGNRRGVSFSKLSSSQKISLEEFIEKNSENIIH